MQLLYSLLHSFSLINSPSLILLTLHRDCEIWVIVYFCKIGYMACYKEREHILWYWCSETFCI